MAATRGKAALNLDPAFDPEPSCSSCIETRASRPSSDIFCTAAAVAARLSSSASAAARLSASAFAVSSAAGPPSHSSFKRSRTTKPESASRVG